jgi:membrane-associated protease RseP (regulator of RpoE activity)
MEMLAPGRRDLAHPYSPEPGHKPSPGEIRQIHIEKSSENLGIMIAEGAVGGASSAGSAGGVFVSSVSTNSLASQAGLQVGDQLLEVCGINLRMANYDQAAQVLHRVGNSIDIKVQFNPDKFPENQLGEGSDSQSESSEEDEEQEAPVLARRSSPRGSGSPTPRNSPKVSRAALKLEERSSAAVLRNPLAHPSVHNTLTRQQVQRLQAERQRLLLQPDREPKPGSFREKKSQHYHEPRLVYPVMKKSGDLGVRLVGGNAVGIFIHSVDMDSPAHLIGLHSADQILEYNGTDLKNATAEQAAYELAKPAENVAILVQFNPDRYNVIKDHPGDSYFVKAMFDRIPDSNDPLLLRFKKNDILYVDNTMYNGVPGHWSAWLVNQEGQKGTWGIVPSKYKVEEELLLRRTHGGEMDSDSSRRSSTSTRRSFFKRRNKSARSSSRDSKELACYSDVQSLLSYSDSGTLHEEPAINSYIRVEKWDFMMTRPILIVGPLADAVVDKLVCDYPNLYIRCLPEYVDSDMNALEKGVIDNIFVDFKRRGSHYECTTVASIRDICDRVGAPHIHCSLLT